MQLTIMLYKSASIGKLPMILDIKSLRLAIILYLISLGDNSFYLLDKNITGSATIFQLIVNQSQVLLKKIN
jgi:hypothetical protein